MKKKMDDNVSNRKESEPNPSRFHNRISGVCPEARTKAEANIMSPEHKVLTTEMILKGPFPRLRAQRKSPKPQRTKNNRSDPRTKWRRLICSSQNRPPSPRPSSFR